MEDVMLLENSKTGIQLAARIVDTPCSEMNTDAFLDEVKNVALIKSCRVKSVFTSRIRVFF